MDIKVLLQALNQPWMIHPDMAQHFAFAAAKLLAGEKASLWEDYEEKEEAFAFVVDASGKRIGGIQDAVDNGVAVINLKGAVMKYDYCGAPGTQSMIKALQQANDNASISAIVLQIDSPGGSVDGTQQMANAVKNSAKPVVAYVNGMMCSAAMWIGSAAQQRIASSNTDVIGSIGTMASWADFSGYYKQMGVVKHEVYASDSTHKNIQFREANGNNTDGSTNYEPMIKTWLDPLNAEFTGAIQQNLPGVDKTVLNGSHYLATQAKSKGLIDKIGTFEQAVNTALKLAKNSETQQKHNQMKWTKVLAFLGIAAAVSSAQDIKLEDSQVDNMEALIAERDTLKADLKAAQDQLAAADIAKTTAEQSLATANTRITELEKQDAAIPSAAVAEKDKNQSAEVSANGMDFQQALYNKL